MFLYSRGKYKIEVFTLLPNLPAICKYKHDKLRENKLKFFIHESYEYPEPLNDSFVSKQGDKALQENEINRPQGYSEMRNFLHEDKNVDLESFIIKYSDGGCNWDPIQIITKNNSKEILYRLLLTQHFYDGHVMKGIVDLPETIYLLNLLEKGNITKLVDEEISEQLGLFNLNLFDRLSIDEYKRGCDCMIIPGCYNGNMQKVEETEKILAKIK